MIRNFKHIISLFLLTAFLLPTVIRFDHNHEHYRACTAQNEKHIHLMHEKCGICNFGFSLFTPDIENLDLQKDNPPDSYNNNYNSLYHSGLSQFSFLLRAPPFRLV